jgi:hypothetical protein
MKKIKLILYLIIIIFSVNCASGQSRFPDNKKIFNVRGKRIAVWVEDSVNDDPKYSSAWGLAIGNAAHTAFIIFPVFTNNMRGVTEEIYTEGINGKGVLKKKLSLLYAALTVVNKISPVDFIIFSSAKKNTSIIPQTTKVDFQAVLWDVRYQRVIGAFAQSTVYPELSVGVQKVLFAQELIDQLLFGDAAIKKNDQNIKVKKK